MFVQIAPGAFHLATAGWFWGIWVSLFLVLCIIIGLIIAKKYTDKTWEEKGKQPNYSYLALYLLSFDLQSSDSIVIEMKA